MKMVEIKCNRYSDEVIKITFFENKNNLKYVRIYIGEELSKLIEKWGGRAIICISDNKEKEIAFKKPTKKNIGHKFTRQVKKSGWESKKMLMQVRYDYSRNSDSIVKYEIINKTASKFLVREMTK